MYGKIFHSIYDGTLAEDWRALITFQQLIVLCDADGIVDMTPQSISRRTGIPIEHIEHGLEILISPDNNSRSDTEQGKRIIPLDPSRNWGWQIVNHKHYKELRTSDDRREYMRNYMRDARSKQKLTKANDSKQLTQLADTDTDTDTNTDTKIKTKGFRPPSVSEVKKYCDERKNQIDPESFISFYESKGWMIGKNKMKNWKSAIITWEKRNGTSGKKQDSGFDGRSRAKKVSDKLDTIAKEDVEQNGFASDLDSGTV